MSNSETKVNVSGGIGLPGLLTCIFVVCKILEVHPIANWSWWWVFSPLWISALLFIGIFIIIAAGAVILGMLK